MVKINILKKKNDSRCNIISLIHRIYIRQAIRSTRVFNKN